MKEKVAQFPLPPSQKISFRIGDRLHVLIIPAVPPYHQPKRAEVIPISTTSSGVAEPTEKLE